MTLSNFGSDVESVFKIGLDYKQRGINGLYNVFILSKVDTLIHEIIYENFKHLTC